MVTVRVALRLGVGVWLGVAVLLPAVSVKVAVGEGVAVQAPHAVEERVGEKVGVTVEVIVPVPVGTVAQAVPVQKLSRKIKAGRRMLPGEQGSHSCSLPFSPPGGAYYSVLNIFFDVDLSLKSPARGRNGAGLVIKGLRDLNA